MVDTRCTHLAAAGNAPHRDSTMYLDLGSNPRIPLFMDLAGSLARMTDPDEVRETFLSTMQKVHGPTCYIELTTRGLPAGTYRIARWRAPDGQEWVAADSARRAPRNGEWQARTYHGGLLGELIATPSPKVCTNLDLRDDAALSDRLGAYRSGVAVPLFDLTAQADWIVVLDTRPDAFSSGAAEELVLRANLVAGAINTLRISRQLREANERHQHQIDVIADIQKSLLPEGPFNVPGLRIEASYQTFDTAGGDMYDILPLARRVGVTPDGAGGAGATPLQDDRWAFLIADVSGHGAAAAVVMAMLQTILHIDERWPNGPAALLGHLNRHLCAKRIEQSFVTAFLAFYEPGPRRLTYARAGHNPPILKAFPHRGDPERLDRVGDIPLGIDADVQYAQAQVTLQSGQTLILYTDGVTEARVPGGEMFGVEGVERSLIHCSGEPDCAIDHITGALKAHQPGVRPNDDQTIVAIQVL